MAFIYEVRYIIHQCFSQSMNKSFNVTAIIHHSSSVLSPCEETIYAL